MGQLLVWELVVLTLVVLAREPWPARIAVGVPALLLLVLTAVRARGRWLFQWVGAWLRFRSRRRSRPLGADPAGAVLTAVTPGAVLGTLPLDGEPAALLEHAGGLTAVLEVRLGAGPESRAEARLLPPLSLLLPAADEESEVAVQVLVRSVPAPVLPAGDDPAAISYRELTGGQVPARRRCWVALQVQHTAEDVPAAEQRAVLAAAVQRVQRRLRKAGLTGTPVSPEQLPTDLLEVAGAEAAPAGTVREDWSTWTAGGPPQASWRFAAWPDLADPRCQRLVEDLLGLPVLATTVAVAARRVGTDDVELEAAVRTGLPTRAALGPVHRALTELADGHGARLRRLTGEQAAGAAGTLPLGGFLR
nr:type VII secretion protein EccE [Modestobacter versicolor]